MLDVSWLDTLKLLQVDLFSVQSHRYQLSRQHRLLVCKHKHAITKLVLMAEVGVAVFEAAVLADHVAGSGMVLAKLLTVPAQVVFQLV